MFQRLSTLAGLVLLLCLPSLGASVTYPGPVAVDDAGATVSPTSISVASVTDIDGTAITSPGAVAHVAGPNTSVVYDAGVKGEAWVTLTPVLSGHTFANNPPRIFCSSDPQTLAAVQTSIASLVSNILSAVIDGSITLKQAETLNLAVNSGHYTIGTLNTSAHTRTYTYYRQDGTTVLATSVVTYASDNATVLSRAVTFSNLP